MTETRHLIKGSIHRSKRSERGIAVILCLLCLMLLTAIGFGLVFMSDTESQINFNYRDTQQAYFAAQAGLHDARISILNGNGPVGLPGAAATGVVYLTNPKPADTVQPWVAGTNTFFDDQLCNEQFPGLGLGYAGAGNKCTAAPVGNWYTNIVSTEPYVNTAKALDYKWVRMTLKTNLSAQGYPVANPATTVNTIPICWDGQSQTPLPAGLAGCDDRNGNKFYEYVYRLTSLAVTNAGSRRMLQMEVANVPPFTTNAAVDSQDHVTLNGQLTVNGYDYCTCTCTTSHGNTTCTDRSGMTCDGSHYAIYAHGTVDNPNASEQIIAGTTPAIAQSQPWNYDIAGLINQYKQNAVNVTGAPYNWSCSAGTYPTQGSCGTQSGANFGIPPAFPPTPPSNPASDPNLGPQQAQITYVPGDLQITASANGNGILIVDGDLNIHGGLQFYGLVLVRGVIKFTGGGSDKTNIYGAVLAGQESVVDNVLGGSAVINFNKCALSRKLNNNPPAMLNAHEVMY